MDRVIENHADCLQYLRRIHDITRMASMKKHEHIPFNDYIQIHRRLRATRSAYYLNNWRLLLPPLLALFAFLFAVQSLVLSGMGAAFTTRGTMFLLFALISLIDGPRCLKKRRQIIVDEWKSTAMRDSPHRMKGTLEGR